MKKNTRSPLRNKKVLLGVTGSVAAYKAVDLARRLKDEEADVTPIMTSASLNFITPLSLGLAAGRKPLTGIFDSPLSHVNSTSGAELFIVAPATANTIGKLACGIADDVLGASYLAFQGVLLLAPAMNSRMYLHPAVRKNLEYLKSLGAVEIPPACGTLACGEEGVGKMAPVETIVEAARFCMEEKDLSGKKIIVTAGPTREYLDPVRFLSNRSSGKMGYALARAAAMRGARVVLVSGPSALPAPFGIDKFLQVETTSEMKDAVMKNLPGVDILIMAAAPADFMPEKFSKNKIEKTASYNLKLKVNYDILSGAAKAGKKPVLIGFAAETGPETARARRKLKEKKLDMIIMNDVTAHGSGFDHDTNRAVLIRNAVSGFEELPLMTKDELAFEILDRVKKIRN